MKSSTAILIFSRTATAEARHKTIAGRHTHNITAHKYLLSKTISNVKDTGIPYFHFTEKEQRGATFEDRLQNSFNRVFQEGYENIICIGSDCPQLTAINLAEGKIAVESGAACFGADISGGVYLIAISQKQFKAGILEGISWHTSKAFAQLKQNFDTSGLAYILLSPYKDINDKKNLLNYLNTREINSSLKWVLLILLGFKEQFINIGLYRKLFIEVNSVCILRGPPVCFN